MANDTSANRPTVNPGEASGAPANTTPPPAPSDETQLEVGMDLNGLELGDLAGADAGALVRQAKDPFDGYDLKPEQKIGEYIDQGKKKALMVSPTHIVAYIGKMPNDPAMEGRPVEHNRAIRSRFSGKIEDVSFNRTVGKVQNCAIVTDNSIRSQLVWTTDNKGRLVEDSNYKLVDKDQLMRLAREFALRNPGENLALARQIMGEE